MEKKEKKTKQQKSSKSGEKEKLPLFPHDLKSIKENFKKEFLRTVKINNSFRVKGPRATKVVMKSMDSEVEVDNNHIGIDNEINGNHSESIVTTSSVDKNCCNCKCNEEYKYNENIKNSLQQPLEALSFGDNEIEDVNKGEYSEFRPDISILDIEKGVRNTVITSDFNETEDIENSCAKSKCSDKDHATALPNIGPSFFPERNRKYSLDNNVLTRRQTWSQSEIDLHSVGKSPLERKSSFFRKKLDRFFKNTSEIFKKQSANAKVENVKRRGSISFSMQSLNNPAIYEDIIQEPRTSVRMLVYT